MTVLRPTGSLVGGAGGSAVVQPADAGGSAGQCLASGFEPLGRDCPEAGAEGAEGARGAGRRCPGADADEAEGSVWAEGSA
ncbi:hypothetical protein, partial [Streptomyces poriferorum]|uniref:hypothetical protein n=1 Tax=Streptomyces poriferorum TaxID=2798799 RepID=UPI001C5D7FDA